LQNSLVSGNAAASANASPDISQNGGGGITTDNGHNLFGTALAGTTSGPGDLFTDVPLLAPLGNYGGATQTLALLPGSPAIAAGAAVGNGVPVTDQRGINRPADGPVDIGAGLAGSGGRRPGSACRSSWRPGPA
jgi:hypothetical protein